MDESAVRLAFDLLTRHGLGRRRVADTLLAASLLSHDVHHIATFNTADFAPFEGLEAYEPRLAVP